MISTISSSGPVIVYAARFSPSLSGGRKLQALSHHRELKAMDYVSEGNGFKITSAGRIAII